MERKKLIIVMVTILLIMLFFVIYFLFMTVFGRKKLGLYTPTLLESEKDIQDTKNCDPMTSLQSCTNLGDPCIQCYNKDAFSCQKVQGGKIIYSDGKEGGPINIEDRNGNTFFVPDGTWCLPVETVQKSPCNPFTSTPILTKVNDGLYQWRCYCKYPGWISSSGISKDCDVQIACNHQDDPNNNYLVYCKDQGPFQYDETKGKYVCKDGSEPIKWTPQSEVDLPKHAFCNCGPGSYYYGNDELGIKQCVANPCGEGNKPFWNEETKELDCNCDNSGCPKDGDPCNEIRDENKCQISCSKLPVDKRGECAIGCIKDPCVASGGVYDVGGKKCDCCCPHPGPPDPHGNPTCIQGSIFMKDENFLAGGYCANVKDTCKHIDCEGRRGGQCGTCPTETGYGTYVNVPYCYSCDYTKGFAPDPLELDCNNPKNCKPCNYWFADCKWNSGSDAEEAESDNACCTGRCNNQSKKCLPCNDPGINSGDDGKDRHDKQKKWDKRCRSYYCKDDDDCSSTKGGADVPIRQYCNLYKVDEGIYTDWSCDGRIGFCETEKNNSPGARYDSNQSDNPC
jgi:hypothetical protein